MIILGIDPGTATIGVGVVECNGEELSALHFGWIETSKDDSPGKRLVQIHSGMRAILQTHKPDVLAIERLFFFANHKTAMAVSESIGVIKLAAEAEQVRVVSFAPLEIKCAVCGSGKADKEAVKKTVRQLLKVRSPKKKKTHFDDLCDALAVAICYAKKEVLSPKAVSVTTVANGVYNNKNNKKKNNKKTKLKRKGVKKQNG
jgi:crossover junction endodeoxyribonuclease RuvC